MNNKLDHTSPDKLDTQAKISQYKEKIPDGTLVINDRGGVYQTKVGSSDTGKVYYKLVCCDNESRTYGEVGLNELIGAGKRFEVLGKPQDGQTVQDLLDKWEATALDAFTNPQKYAPEPETPNATSTDLVLSSGPERLQAAISLIEDKKSIIRIAQWMIESKRALLSSYVSQMSKTITKMQAVIDIFELYLGINEDIIQIQGGQAAPENTPITIRQLVLFMDEEVGDPEAGGIDFQRVDDFDNWLTTNQNYQKLIPEIKGVVALRPSRQKRLHFSRITGAPFLAVQEDDKRCYLLIRNGDNIYRIFTSMAKIGDYLIPPQDELINILAKIESGGYYDRERAEDAQLTYSRKALMIQGLLDRTDVFSPVPRPIKVTDPNEDLVNFIYDGESILPDGRKAYRDWKKEINGTITKGSRIIISFGIDDDRNWYGGDDRSRFTRYYSRNSPNIPPFPKAGVYVVEEVLPPERYSNQDRLIIRYNPKDIVYDTSWGGYYEGHERKNRVGFTVYRSDSFVFCYDQVDFDSIEYYLGARTERKHYLDMVPTLWDLRKKRLAEMELEKLFVNLIIGETKKAESDVWTAVEWWKNRTQLKRPLTQDDSKAHRMIKQYLNGAWKGEKRAKAA